MSGAATVDKALDVLFHLHAADTPLALGEIARALGLAKSSCHRLLATMVQREVVEQDEGGRYRPGLALLALGLGVQRREPVVELARPHLEAEADRLGETVFLVAARGGRLRVIDQCAGRGFLRAAPTIGDEIPADVTAAGKLYRAHAEAEGIDAAGPIAPEEAQSIRRQGHAVNRDAWIEGLSVLAVPIWQRGFDRRDRLVAVMALAAASSRFDALGADRVAAHLTRAAEAVSERLGVRPTELPRRGLREVGQGSGRRSAGDAERAGAGRADARRDAERAGEGQERAR
ncbi:MAG: helix-turn-helix domain-containing protein [Myxococcota bacterium]